jgi:hypothetical protein
LKEKMMRVTSSLNIAALAVMLATALGAANLAHAQIEETLDRDAARIAATTTPPTPTPPPLQQAKGPSFVASDAGSHASVPRTDRWFHGAGVQFNAAGIPVDPRYGTEASGYNLGGTY